LTRRALLAGFASAAAVACSRRESPPAAPPAAAPAPLPPLDPVVDAAPLRGETRVTTWTLPERGASGEAVVVLPADELDGGASRWPLVVLLHGRGEALKSPKDGALGWVHDYALTRQIARVNNPPLGPDDVEGFVDPERLALYNRQLEERPFQGLAILCPYLPDINLRSHADLADYARYVAEVLVPRARRELPVFGARESTGIDGVSLGGATALRVGFGRSETFGAVGGLQPAVSDDQTQEWVELARAARAKRPDLKLRLTTSHDDVYHDVIRRLSAALLAAGVAHDYADIVGPHDYPFNRGPGAIEVLLWHDRVLARSA
ncbi:MAG TPA: hypothetical protein VGI39_18505, partial [Polyangiaceae bacterium]